MKIVKIKTQCDIDTWYRKTTVVLEDDNQNESNVLFNFVWCSIFTVALVAAAYACISLVANAVMIM